MPKEEQTCGKGIADDSPLPAKLGELAATLGAVLEIHMSALVMTDENSRREYDAYERLARALNDASARLKSRAREMSGYQDLPMGRHDMDVMAGPAPVAAFERYVAAKRELLALSRDTLAPGLR